MNSLYTKPSREAVFYDGRSNGKHYVIGDGTGASLIAFATTAEEALNEHDERFGERVEPTDSALPDYMDEERASQLVVSGDARTISEARLHAAIDSGDARMNDGGTVVWVDPHEWMREFPGTTDGARDAMRCFLGLD